MSNPEEKAALERIKKYDHARKLYDDGKYKLAQEQFLELFNLHEETDKQLDFALKIAKCDLDIGDEIYDGNMTRVYDVLQQMKLSGKEIGEMADKKEDVDSVILWFLASKRFAYESDPISISNCFMEVDSKLKNFRSTPTNHIMVWKLLTLMQNMVKMLQEIDGTREKVESALNLIVLYIKQVRSGTTPQ